MSEPLSTYSLLRPKTEVPSEYEIVTSRLLYYVERGFEIKTPVTEWYETHQKNSKIAPCDWEAFSDPRETTYTKYTRLQRDKELQLDACLEEMETATYAKHVSAEWKKTLSTLVFPLRYVGQGFHMGSAYIGQMAPSGRITLAALFQAGDELRRMERIAYRLCQLQKVDSTLGADSQKVWQEAPFWQPTRKAIEKMLVTYDWAESFVALNLCLKPILDETMMACFATYAKQNEDPKLHEVLSILYEDCLWQRAWSTALLQMAVTQNPKNLEVLSAWEKSWSPLAFAAADALCDRMSELAQPSKSQVREFYKGFTKQWHTPEGQTL